jgi:hypothetical protein
MVLFRSINKNTYNKNKNDGRTSRINLVGCDGYVRFGGAHVKIMDTSYNVPHK